MGSSASKKEQQKQGDLDQDFEKIDADQAEILVPNEEENLMFDVILKKQKFEFDFKSTLELLENIQRYNVRPSVYTLCESQRKDEQYFKIENIIESSNIDLNFLKVIDFYRLEDLDLASKYERTRKNKRTIKEIVLLKNFKSRAAPLLLGYTADEECQRIYMIYEYYETQLYDLIKHNKLGTFYNKIRLLRNLIEILMSLHSTGIVSYDLHPVSIGITLSDNVIKLMTFGNSLKFNDSMSLMHETCFDRSLFDMFTAPEVYYNREIKLKSSWSPDIWSLGIISACIFQSNDTGSAFKTFKKNYEAEESTIYSENGIFDFGRFYQILNADSIENPFFQAFVATLISPNPDGRPNIFQVADNYNKLTELLSLDFSYKLIYSEESILSFLKVFDYPLLEIVNDIKADN